MSFTGAIVPEKASRDHGVGVPRARDTGRGTVFSPHQQHRTGHPLQGATVMTQIKTHLENSTPDGGPRVVRAGR